MIFFSFQDVQNEQWNIRGNKTKIIPLKCEELRSRVELRDESLSASSITFYAHKNDVQRYDCLKTEITEIRH